MTARSRTAKADIGQTHWRQDGRLLVSYPKSGRTWLRFGLDSADIEATLTHAGASTNRREIGKPYLQIPAGLRNLPFVFLHRNPLDTAVSMFHQVIERDLRPGTGRWLRMWLPLTLRGALPPRDIDAFVLHPLHGIEKVCAYNRLWLDHLARRSDCLVLTYEAMRADPTAGYQRLLDHWGETSVTGATLAEASSFERMKAAETAGRGIFGNERSAATSTAKVRKGKVAGYLEELHPETVQAAAAIARRYGFEITASNG